MVIGGSEKMPVSQLMSPINPKWAIYLSRKLVQLLGWDLPKSKIPFLTQDGSAKIHEVAKYFGILVDDVKDAAFPIGRNGEGRIKERVIVYELNSYGNTDIQISVCPWKSWISSFYPPRSLFIYG